MRVVGRVSVIVAASAWCACCASLGMSEEGRCRSELAPSEDALTAVVDSASLTRDLAALWRPDFAMVLATLSYDSVGVLDTAEVLSAHLPTDARRDLTRELTEAAPRTRGAGERIHLFIGDGAGPAPRRVERFAGCAPVMLDTDHLGQMLEAEGRILGIRRVVTVRLAVRVEADGHVGEVRIARSSGDGTVDEAASRVMGRATFLPARVEDIPVPVWATFPVTFRPPGRSSR